MNLNMTKRSSRPPVPAASALLLCVTATAIALAQAPAPPASPASPESVKRAEDVLTAARNALGAQKLAGVKTIVATGRTKRVRGDNLVPIEFEMFLELPDKFVRVDEFPAEDADPTSSGFNGEALIQIPSRRPRPRGLAGACRLADLARRHPTERRPLPRRDAPRRRLELRPVLPRPLRQRPDRQPPPRNQLPVRRQDRRGRPAPPQFPAGGECRDQAAEGRQWIRAARASPR